MDLDAICRQDINNNLTKLNRILSMLGIDEKICQICKHILIHVETGYYLDKHNPLSRIAAIIYYVIDRLNIKINKYQIIQTCEVSELTINKCYQKFCNA